MSITKEKIQVELTGLRKRQLKIREDEAFGGLSSAEKSEYAQATERINDLERELASNPEPETAQEQKPGWNRDAEIDTPQSEVRQPYGSREKASGNAFTSRTGRRRRKSDSQKLIVD